MSFEEELKAQKERLLKEKNDKETNHYTSRSISFADFRYYWWNYERS